MESHYKDLSIENILNVALYMSYLYISWKHIIKIYQCSSVYELLIPIVESHYKDLSIENILNVALYMTYLYISWNHIIKIYR